MVSSVPTASSSGSDEHTKKRGLLSKIKSKTHIHNHNGHNGNHISSQAAGRPTPTKIEDDKKTVESRPKMSKSSSFFKHLKSSSSATLDRDGKNGLARTSTTASQHRPHARPSSQPGSSTNIPLPQQKIVKSSTTIGHAATDAKINDILGTSGNVIASPRDQPKPKLNTPLTLGLPSIDDYKPERKSNKLTYNPYGMRTAHLKFAEQAKKAIYTFDPTDDESNILPFPVEMPNDHLPDGFKVEHQELFEEFEFLEHDTANIGSGASSSVRKVHKINKPKELYALKKFTLFKDETPAEFYERAAKEYIIHKNLCNGLHVVNCVSLIKIPHQQKLIRGWGFILELCSLDLYSLIDKPTWIRTHPEEKLCIFKQVCYGIKYIHECDIVHRDIKPENILLTKEGIVKLTDFGVSDYGHVIPGDFQSEIKLSTQLVGSPPYQPPEVQVMNGLSTSKRTPYDPFRMDHWGLGMLLFTLFMGGVPFAESSRKDSQAYRDYETSYDQYIRTKNPNFRKFDYAKGPGIEFHFAKFFSDKHIARIAWRLCDPNLKTRYSMYDLYNDPAFQKIEMCVNENDYGCNFYHHADSQFRGKFEYGLGSNSSSSASLANGYGTTAASRSRKNTIESPKPPQQSIVSHKSMTAFLDSFDIPKHSAVVASANGSSANGSSSSSSSSTKINGSSKPLSGTPANGNGAANGEPVSSSSSSSISSSANVHPMVPAPTIKEYEELEINDDQATFHDAPAELITKPATSITSTTTTTQSSVPTTNGVTGPPSISRSASVATLDSLCTREGIMPIKLRDFCEFKVIPSEVIKKCGDCKIKPHHHVNIRNY